MKNISCRLSLYLTTLPQGLTHPVWRGGLGGAPAGRPPMSTIESRNRANFWKSRSLIGCQFAPRKKMRPISGCDGSNFWVYNVIKICGFWRVEEKKVRKRQIQI